jgi:PAS domain S-box-containing protein
MGRVFNRGVLLGIVAVVASLVVSAGIAYRNTWRLDEDATWVAHSHEVLSLTSNVLLTLVYAEAGQRSFLVTGKDEFLQPNNPALARLSKNMVELKDKTKDNPRQQDRIGELEEMIAGYHARLQEGIDQRHKGLDEAQAILTLKRSEEQMNAIKDLVADMEREEHAILNDREVQSRRTYSVAVATGLLATALALVLIVVLVCLLYRSLLARQRAEETIRKVSAEFADRVTTKLRKTTEALSQSDLDLTGSEQMLRQSEERVQELTAHIQQVLWMIDAEESKILYVSVGYEKMWGRSCQSLIDNSHSFMEGISPLDQEMMRRENVTMYQTGHIDAECRVLRPDGFVRWVWIRGYPITEQGRIVRIVGVIEDITEKRHLAAERDALLSRLQLHIQRMPLAYVLFDADFRIIDWNPTAERIFGYAREEMLGKGPPYEQFVPRSFWEKGEEIRNRIRSGDMKAHSVNENLTKDGRTIVCQWLNTPLMDENSQFVGLLGLAQDVTEQRSLEAQLHQAQKMEAIGHLAGGVAHDFNNLLTIILGYSEIILSKLGPSDPMREFIKAISVAGERAASLTRQLLAFSRKTVLEPKVLDLNEVVKETDKFLRRLIGEDILLTTTLDPTISRVKVDPDQLGQILMNLAVNSCDAMPKGGNLTVETRNVELGQEYARLRPEIQPGQYVLLSITDTGSGMTAEVKSRIFEPFFTTKGVGKGTGLGLAVVLGIVRQSGGYVEVYSELEIGTTFNIYFPAVEDQKFAPKAIDAGNSGHGTETVLLVEDEESVRGLAIFVLQTHGYRVLAAGNGKEAMELIEKHQGGIDLLVTDVVMPGMGGPDLAEALRPHFLQMKVLYSSGYTDDAVVRHGLLQDKIAFLQKPYMPLALVRKVRQVLDEK